MNLSEAQLREFAHYMIAKGEQTKIDAGYRGDWGDGGGGRDIAEAQAFLAGLDRRLPDDWKAEFKRMRDKEDIEYKEYLRLKAKFESGT
jgi:hypothetical protein